MVVLSLEKYAEPTDDVEIKLDEADIEAESTDIRHKHGAVFSRVRSKVDASKYWAKCVEGGELNENNYY